MRVWVRLPPRDSRHACPAERCHGWCADLIESHLIESHLIESDLVWSRLATSSHLPSTTTPSASRWCATFGIAPDTSGRGEAREHATRQDQSVVRHVRDRTRAARGRQRTGCMHTRRWARGGGRSHLRRSRPPDAPPRYACTRALAPAIAAAPACPPSQPQRSGTRTCPCAPATSGRGGPRPHAFQEGGGPNTGGHAKVPLRTIESTTAGSYLPLIGRGGR